MITFPMRLYSSLLEIIFFNIIDAQQKRKFSSREKRKRISSNLDILFNKRMLRCFNFQKVVSRKIVLFLMKNFFSFLFVLIQEIFPRTY